MVPCCVCVTVLIAAVCSIEWKGTPSHMHMFRLTVAEAIGLPNRSVRDGRAHRKASECGSTTHRSDTGPQPSPKAHELECHVVHERNECIIHDAPTQRSTLRTGTCTSCTARNTFPKYRCMYWWHSIIKSVLLVRRCEWYR